MGLCVLFVVLYSSDFKICSQLFMSIECVQNSAVLNHCMRVFSVSTTSTSSTTTTTDRQNNGTNPPKIEKRTQFKTNQMENALLNELPLQLHQLSIDRIDVKLCCELC